MSVVDEELLANAVLTSSSDAIIATDREGLITFWNPGAERIFGFNKADAIGSSLDLIIPERLRAAHWTGYREVMRTGVSRYGEGDLLSVPSLTRDGARISVEFTIVPLADPVGGMLGTVAVLRDVTSRFEEMKKLRRKIADSSGRTSDEGK
jgi:PAS domain S-box-containing protein